MLRGKRDKTDEEYCDERFWQARNWTLEEKSYLCRWKLTPHNADEINEYIVKYTPADIFHGSVMW